MVRPYARAALGGVLPLVAAAAVAIPTYRATVEYGFRYDDYYLVRPHTAEEVLASFSGTWDPGGVMVPFYRPLTVAFHALRFELFHLDARTHHVVSLALFVLAATGLGWFVSRTTSSRWLGTLTAACAAAHPGMPAGAVAWITNQMHLLQMLTFVAGVLWWTVCRARPARWWLPLLFLQVVAFLVKEDGVMLLPTIVTLHVIYGAFVESRWSQPPFVILAAAAALLLGLVWWRDHALGGLGGYARPTLEAAWSNYWRGLQGTFLQQPPDRRWQPLLAAITVMVVPSGMVVAALRRQARRAGFVLLAGIAVAALYNLPFALVTKTEQYYMLAFGAALALAGAVGAIGAGPAQAGPHVQKNSGRERHDGGDATESGPADAGSHASRRAGAAPRGAGNVRAAASPARAGPRVRSGDSQTWGPPSGGRSARGYNAARALIGALAVSLVLIMAVVARDIAADFGPYFPFTLETDRIVLTWGAAVPPEIRNFLQKKRRRWDRDREPLRMADHVTVASYGLYDEETGNDAQPFRWTTGHVQFYASCAFERMDAEIRALHPDLAGRPVGVTLVVEGSPWSRLSLESAAWTPIALALPPCVRRQLRSTRVVELRVDRTWSPAAAGASQGDTRQLGVMLRDVRWSDDAPGSREP